MKALCYAFALFLAPFLAAHALESNTSLLQLRRSQGAVVIANVTQEAGVVRPAKLQIVEMILDSEKHSLEPKQEIEIDPFLAGTKDSWRLRKGVSLVFIQVWESDEGVEYAPVLSIYLGSPVSFEDYQKDQEIEILGFPTDAKALRKCFLEHLSLNPRLNARFAHAPTLAKAKERIKETPRMLLGDERIALWGNWLKSDQPLLALDALVGAYELAEVLMPLDPGRPSRHLPEQVIAKLQSLVSLGLERKNRWLHSAALALGERIGFPASAKTALLKIANAGPEDTLFVVWHEANRALLELDDWDTKSLEVVLNHIGLISGREFEIENIRSTLAKVISKQPARRMALIHWADQFLESESYAVQIGAEFIKEHYSDKAFAAAEQKRKEQQSLADALRESKSLSLDLAKRWLKEYGKQQSFTKPLEIRALEALLPRAFGELRAMYWQGVANFEGIDLSKPTCFGAAALGLHQQPTRKEAIQFFVGLLNRPAEADISRLQIARILSAYGEKQEAAVAMPTGEGWEEQYWLLAARQRLNGESGKLEAFVKKLKLREALSGRDDNTSPLSRGNQGREVLPKMVGLIDSKTPFASIVVLRTTYWLNRRSGLWMGFTPDLLEDPAALRALQARWQKWVETLPAQKWDRNRGIFIAQ